MSNGSSSTQLNLCHRRAQYGGFTARERLKNDFCSIRRWQPGVFLGIVMESNQRIVGTTEGFFWCDQSRDAQQCTDTLQTFSMAPWDPRPPVTDPVDAMGARRASSSDAQGSSSACHQETLPCTRRSREERILQIHTSPHACFQRFHALRIQWHAFFPFC